MLRDIITSGNLAHWPQFSVLIFTLTFTGIFYHVYRKKNRSHYDYMAHLTMDETEHNHGR